MRVHIFAFFVSLIISFSLSSIYFREIKAESEILGQETKVERQVSPTSPPTPEVTERQVTSSPSPTQTPTPTPILLPSLTPIPTPTFVPQPPVSSEQIHQYIERFAGQYGVDANVLRHIAVCESGFNPVAVNGAYAGLYQFTLITWKNNRVLMGEDTNPDLRFNAEEAVQTAAYIISIGRGSVWPNCYP